MKFIEDIQNDKLWRDFLLKKSSDVYTPKHEVKYLTRLVEKKGYLKFYDWIQNKEYLSTQISKKQLVVSGKDKRRVVYCYSRQYISYQYFFKFINWRLKEYDDVFSNNLYSFRSGYKIGNAVKKLANYNTYKNKYKAKLDIHDYFRSIRIDLLMPLVEKVIDDKDFIAFVESYLSISTFVENGKPIKDNAGVFPGNPISGFLSNLFLTELDKMHENTNVDYYRYADDILITANSKEETLEGVKRIETYLASVHLEINPKKKDFFLPNTPYNFLGLSFNNKKVTISQETIHKIKAKIHRSARKIRRWCLSRHAKPIVGVKILIRKYNAKFFGIIPNEQSWLHWYFPYIQDDKALHEVDRYFYQEARYIMTGKHDKKGYKNLPYKTLQELGYKSLVREYHHQLENKEEKKIPNQGD